MTSKPLRPSQPTVLQGRVVLVDSARWTCVVYCDTVKREFTNVIIPSLYSTPSGEGIHYMPEVGALCFVCAPSDGAGAFLLLSAPQPSAATQDGQPGSYHSGRPYLSPGDMAILTRDGNGIIARRGGVTEFRGTALSRIVTNPFINQILTIAENWKVETFGGSMEWKSYGREEDAFGDLTCAYTFRAREYVNSGGWTVSSEAGSIRDPASGALSRLELDGPIAVPALVDTPVTLQVEGELGVLTPLVVTMKKPASFDTAAVVYRFSVCPDESADESASRSFVCEIARKGDARVTLDGKIRITSNSGSESQPVLLGTDFLGKLQDSLTEIKGALASLGIPATPATDALLSDIVASLATRSPFLSTVLEAD